MAQRIAVIDDERDLGELVRYNLCREGFEVECFYKAKEALDYLPSSRVDLVLLDIWLPDLDGLEVCRRLRADARLKTIPIIFVTAKSNEIDRILGLEMGADDYVVKPFSIRELVARVKRLLQPSVQTPERPDVVEVGSLKIDSRTHELIVQGKTVEISALEFKLLHFLASNPRRIFSRGRLLDEVWGRDRFVTPRTVDVHVRCLRQKIETTPGKPRFILTVRGAGYRFSPQP